MENQDLLITAEQLAHAADDPNLRILDCRFDLLKPDAGRAAFVDAHIPGAVYADLNLDLAAPVGDLSGRHPLPDVDVAAATFGRLGGGPDSKLVVYDDQGGALAARAWWMLRWLGHRNVRLLDGGLPAWTTRGLPLEHGAAEPVPQHFVARPEVGWTIDADELLASPESSRRLVDGRAAARFAGEQEPIDAVAGHVPGAMNLPFERSLTPDGYWRSVEELRRVWAEVFADGLDAPWSVMCGSGVTACHLAFSAELAGFPAPRLYVGSWSEWIRDPARPVAIEGG